MITFATRLKDLGHSSVAQMTPHVANRRRTRQHSKIWKLPLLVIIPDKRMFVRRCIREWGIIATAAQWSQPDRSVPDPAGERWRYASCLALS